MNHVSLDSQDEAVKQFVLNLPMNDNGGSLLELNGRAIALLLPPPQATNGSAPQEEWTDAKNNRRCDLIDRKYSGGLTTREAVELADLQNEMIRHRQRVAPLPLNDARKLHQELLTLALATKSAS